jgi:hypothetical protein
LWHGFAMLGEGMGSLLYGPYQPPDEIQGWKERRLWARNAARADLDGARAGLEGARQKLRKAQERHRRYVASLPQPAVFTDSVPRQFTGKIDWSATAPPPDPDLLSFTSKPMTPQRRELLRKLGLPDLEIDGLAALGLPPFVEALFVTLLLQARTKAQVRTYPWWRDLGLKTRPTTRAEARKAYSEAMLKAHPDHGGTTETMAKVRAAWERAQQEFPEGAVQQ